MENLGENETATPLSSLINRELSGVLFVRDNIQLQFDGVAITYLLFPSIKADGVIFNPDHEMYRNKLVEQIGKTVAHFLAKTESLIINFSDGSSISLSFNYEDIELPEVIVVQDEKRGTQVF